MAVTLASDLKIYPEQFHGALNEKLQYNLSTFNAASGGAISLVSRGIRGDYEYESFFKNMGASVVGRRDTTSVGALTPSKLTGEEIVGVKLNRGYAIDSTYDALKKRLPTEDAQKIFSMVAGEQVAEFVAADYLTSGLAAVNAAIAGQAALNVKQAARTDNGRVTHDILAQGISKHGDMASHLSLLVMHSAPYFGLVRQTIADKLLEATAYTITSGTPQTLNRRVLVTDSASLIHQPAVAAVGTVGVTASTSSFTKTGITAALGAVVDGYIRTAGFTDAANNGVFKITSVSANAIVVDATGITLVDNNASASFTCEALATYNTLLLQSGAVEIAESETPTVIGTPVTGFDNLIYRIQGEHAYNLRCLGFKWDVTNGGANPTASALATSSNWDKVFTDNKQLAGARIVSLA